MPARAETASSINSRRFRDQKHIKRLYNEEGSWYYYLTEAALRRIGNRIINAFLLTRLHILGRYQAFGEHRAEVRRASLVLERQPSRRNEAM
jgi:hypothetical protein